MRPRLLALVTIVAALFPKLGNAQVYMLPTPAPTVSAATQSWYADGQPIFFSGDFYYPTGPTVFFDGNVMVRSGVFRSIPLYTDATITPFSIVYVPIGGNQMRPYERRRAGELAGTVGSKPPSFPIERDVEVLAASGTAGIQTPPRAGTDAAALPESTSPASTLGTSSLSRPTPPEPVAPVIESIPAPRTNDGVWIEYDGHRWYSDGAAVAYSTSRFTQIGMRHGFPVYREKGDRSGRIFVAMIHGGPLTPFKLIDNRPY